MMLGALFGSRGPENAISQVPASTSVWGEWPGDMPAGAARRVTQTEAMQLMAVYGCVRLISDGISTLPVHVFRDPGDGSSEKLQTPEWLVRPTPELVFEEWCSQVLSSLLLRGNAYVRVVRGTANRIVAMPVLDPDAVEVERRASGGKLIYLIDGAEVPGLEMLHIRGMMLPGSYVGLSPLEYARQSIGLGLSAQRFGQDFFDGDGNMPGVIEAPYSMQPETKRETAKQWRQIRRKGGRGLPGVLDMGATWKPTGVTNEQAQFLSTRQYTAAEIAGQVFLVDPSDLGIPVQGTSLTYSNLQDRNTRRVQVTYLPWIVRIERALSSLLASPRFVKFNVDGLLRGSLQDQMNAWAVGIDRQFLVPNEPREWLDLSPLPGGDQVVDRSGSQRAASTPSVENRSPQPQPLTVNNYLTEQRHTIENHIDTPAPVVTVNPEVRAPDVNVSVDVPAQPAPVVNVATPAAEVPVPVVNVTNEVNPTPVTIENEVNVETPRSTHTVRRDADGNIVEITERPA